jgi:hypothetical protein
MEEGGGLVSCVQKGKKPMHAGNSETKQEQQAENASANANAAEAATWQSYSQSPISSQTQYQNDALG